MCRYAVTIDFKGSVTFPVQAEDENRAEDLALQWFLALNIENDNCEIVSVECEREDSDE